MPALVRTALRGNKPPPFPEFGVQFSSWSAAETLAVQRLSAGRTATNTVEVAARFVSCSDQPQTVRVRTSFLEPIKPPPRRHRPGRRCICSHA